MTYKYQYALNVKGQNVNLFTVILEDSLIGKQRNSYGSNSDPLLGEWGQGGKYSAATVRNYPFVDVVRGVVGDTFYGTAGYSNRMSRPVRNIRPKPLSSFLQKS